jgi:protein involved in temperature-dependent protein secretion
MISTRRLLPILLALTLAPLFGSCRSEDKSDETANANAPAYAQSIKLKPSDADARHSLGLLHFRHGNVAAATEQLDALKTLNPDTANKLQQQFEQNRKR